MSSSSVALTELPTRPGFGTTGRLSKVKVNIFRISNFLTNNVFQYDVAITPDIPEIDVSRRLFKLVEAQLPKTGNASGRNVPFVMVFDGRKIAYSNASLPDPSFSIDVVFNANAESEVEALASLPLPESDRPMSGGGGGGRGGRGGGRGGRGGGGGGRGGGRGGFSSGQSSAAPSPQRQVPTPAPKKPTGDVHAMGKKYTVTIKQVAVVNMHELALFVQRQAAMSENISQAMSAISVVLRHVPGQKFISVRNNFFSPYSRIGISQGLEIWRGYHQSPIAMLSGHLGINIDVAAAVFRTGGRNLVDLATELMGCGSPQEIPRVRDFLKLLRELFKNAKVQICHRGDTVRRYRIKDFLRQTPKEYTFTADADGKQVKTNIQEYFKKQYNYTIQYPYLPCVQSSSARSVFPMECLMLTPADRFMKKLNPDQTSDMIRATVQKPAARKRDIDNAVTSILKYNDNAYMKAFGLSVDPNMTEVEARIIPPPGLVFAKSKTLNPREGSWQLRDVQFVEAITIDSMAFVWYARKSIEEAQAIANDLVSKWKKTLNITINKPPPVVLMNPYGESGDVGQNVRAGLRRAFTDAQDVYKNKPKIIVCVIEKGSKGIYEQIKYCSLTEAGIATQCILSSNIFSVDRVKDQFAANVAMKINMKLGGSTNRVTHLPLMDKPTLLVGCDVTHPPPGSAAPSIAALVGSVNRFGTYFRPAIRTQSSRVEIVAEMEQMMGELIDAFVKSNSQPGRPPVTPQRIIFYRDGVSFGQFKEVREKEIAAIKAALEKRKIERCAITFIICQKRHHIRFFPPENSNDRDRSENSLPGTIVEKDVTHPSEFDFYMLSHSGLQGTSRPTHYHVIFDENNVKPDDLYALTYNLAHLPGRATRSISIASPAYFAHHLADKAKLLLQGDFSDLSSSGRGGEDIVPKLSLLTTGLAGTMFFM
ncbi:Piwi domain-containing protein [Polychytrium aggregatum]|uniref:Piwi domain-containing protein n=1 Tax=Polychytrium aggregatum TaxID=110093 RepID=UPI0022FE03F6|nr:Piwi domain-containing protein [Polychytrium aggregatum]KAI9206024.1 Piwi domain-containing protein [Polychytrium aggregatum]